MKLLADSGAFPNKPYVFSYRWATGDEAPIFEHYAAGYRERNRAVATTVGVQRDGVAVVLDVRSFYPSVEAPSVIAKVVARVREGQWRTANEGAAVESYIQQYADWLHDTPVVNGIGIGPLITHVLGNVAMEEVDRALVGRYGDRYSRYVDDIVIVCRSRDADDVTRYAEATLEAAGLTSNSDKRDVVSATDWVASAPTLSGMAGKDSFERLRRDIQLFLAMRPGMRANLREALGSAGFALMGISAADDGLLGTLDRVRYVGAKYRTGLWFSTLIGGVGQLVSRARRTEALLRAELDALLTTPLDMGKTIRRWHVQRVRYILNRLTYLVSRDRYEEIGRQAAEYDELREQGRALMALANGEMPDDLLDRPGPLVGGYCALSRASRPLRRVRVPGSVQWTPTRALSIELLLAYGLLDLSDIDTSATPEAGKTLLNFCAGGIRRERRITDLSAADELDSLGLRMSDVKARAYLETTWTLDERVSLPGVFSIAGVSS